jgi:hypothetical protein
VIARPKKDAGKSAGTFMRTLRLAAALVLAVLAQAHVGPRLAAQEVVMSPPTYGTFQSLQHPEWPSLPWLPFDVPVYSGRSNGTYLYDDLLVDYDTLLQQANSSQQTVASGSGSLGPEPGPPGATAYGCGLWLEIAATNSGVLLTLNNTRPGQSYLVWSITNLSFSSWVVETNVTGVGGNLTQALIAMNGRPSLFLRATEFRDYSVDTNLASFGLESADTIGPPSTDGVSNPYTMGAVGPGHFLESLNGGPGNGSIALYDKSGSLVAQANTFDFFAVTNGGTNYPTGSYLDDGRVLYDWHFRRWVAFTTDAYGSRKVLLAISSNDSPTSLVTGWNRHVVNVDRFDNISDGHHDFTTLGLDDNGIYLTTLEVSPTPAGATNAGQTVVAIKKPEIYQGQFVSTTLEIYSSNTVPVWTLQPAVNYESVSTNDYAWFVAKGPAASGANYQGGAVLYRRLQWLGTNASWADKDWAVVTGSAYRDYYDLDGTNSAMLGGASIGAPAKDSRGVDISTLGSRLTATSIRNGFLWTCQVVGFTGTNSAYGGNESGTNVDRSGVQWLKLSVDADQGLLNYSAHGRVFDNKATTNAFWYYVPSVMVNCTGDSVMGFSGSSATNYIGSFYSWRLANGTMLEQPRPIRVGETNFTSGTQWGDYSATNSGPGG